MAGRCRSMKQLLCSLLLLSGSSALAQTESASDAFYQRHKTALLHRFGRFASEADLRFLLGHIIDRKHLEVEYSPYFRSTTAPLAYLASQRQVGVDLRQIKARLVYPLLRFVLPKTTAKPGVNPGSLRGERIAAQAYQYLGVPYGAPAYDRQTGRGTLDCSGLVRYVFQDLGVALQNVSSVTTMVGSPALKPVAGEPRPGDLLVRKRGNDRWSHVGIYVGNGQLIEAPYTGTVVRLTPYKPETWSAALRYVGR